jgi:hypothetical protein
VGMKESFERQKDSANILQGGVSLNIYSLSLSLPLIFHDKLFNVSAVAESPLSTRLDQNARDFLYV